MAKLLIVFCTVVHLLGYHGSNSETTRTTCVSKCNEQTNKCILDMVMLAPIALGDRGKHGEKGK
ncbi:hypothetical protein CRM22_001086 [Opisthorchis felineus]|uniref:Uncharacterized protein n=1 Tax=Opisthorchis felineus TaxID=147828 RepID=A0A4S2MCD5_OPIFE|nr:hypothetical protein CRM22_001086 [Opisthorchis felineus]